MDQVEESTTHDSKRDIDQMLNSILDKFVEDTNIIFTISGILS